MEQLITIETIPISIEYVEKKPPRASASSSAQLQVERQNNAMSIKSSPVSFQMDSFESGRQIEGSNLTYTATAQYLRDGKLKLHVQMEDVKPDTFLFQQFGRGIDNIMDFLPKSTDSANHFTGMEISFDMSHLRSGMPKVDNIDTSFLPPDLELKVLERPKVIIKYVGGPIYIPKSADPNYEPPANSQINENGSNFNTTV